MRTLTHDQARRVYDAVGRRQDAQAWYEDAAVAHLVQHGAFAGARSIVEAGCGTGRLAATLLADHLPPDARYLAGDPSATMRRLARDRLAPFGARASVVDALGLPAVADGSADRVVSAYVLDLLSDADARALVADARRALAPGGRLLLASLTDGFTPLSRAVAAGWRAAYQVRPEWLGGCRPVQIAPLVSGAGWEIVHHARVAPWGVPSEAVVAVRR